MPAPIPGEADEVGSWATRIAGAVRRGRTHAVAAFVKRAAPIAALSGHIDTLAGWLGHIPAAMITRDPKLSYWKGATLSLSKPAEAIACFRRAFDHFSREELLGVSTLLAWAGLLDAHFLLYRDLRELDPLLEWMTPAVEQAVDGLIAPLQSLIAGSVLFALVFRSPAHARLPAWRERAESLVERNPASELGTRLLGALMCDYTFRADLTGAEMLWQRCNATAAKIRPSPWASVLGNLNLATLRLHQGRLSECVTAVDKGLEASAATGIRVWDGVLSCHGAAAWLSRGNVEAARRYLARVAQMLSEGLQIDEAYYRDMLMWCDFVAGNRVALVPQVEASLSLADRKGAPYFMGIARIFCGIVIHDARDRGRGHALMQEARAIGNAIGNPVIKWSAELFTAHLNYVEGATEEGDAKLHSALQVGRDHGLMHFFSWSRQLIIRLLERALVRNYCPDYVAQLIALHGLHPGALPAASDQWSFAVRVYMFGEGRVLDADGTAVALSSQLIRQVELLSAIVTRGGKAVPISSIAVNLYANADDNALGRVKRVLHSLRHRISPQSIVQQDATLTLDFGVVWVDAMSLLHLRANSIDSTEVEVWLDKYYRGHLLEGIDGSVVVDNLRRRLRAYAARVISDALNRHSRANEHAECVRLEDRWQVLFPEVFPG